MYATVLTASVPGEYTHHRPRGKTRFDLTHRESHPKQARQPRDATCALASTTPPSSLSHATKDHIMTATTTKPAAPTATVIHPACEHHHLAAARHVAAAYHHLQAIDQHNDCHHDAAKAHSETAQAESASAQKHSATAAAHSKK